MSASGTVVCDTVSGNGITYGLNFTYDAISSVTQKTQTSNSQELNQKTGRVLINQPNCSARVRPSAFSRQTKDSILSACLVATPARQGRAYQFQDVIVRPASRISVTDGEAPFELALASGVVVRKPTSFNAPTLWGPRTASRQRAVKQAIRFGGLHLASILHNLDWHMQIESLCLGLAAAEPWCIRYAMVSNLKPYCDGGRYREYRNGQGAF